MPDPKWQGHFLGDIIETQHLLFIYLSRVLEEAGPLPRDSSAAALRGIAAQHTLRPGVKSCLRAVAQELERTEVRLAPSGWEPKVIPGGAGEAAADPEAGAGNGQAGNGRAGNGHASNGSLPAGWRPRFVGDDDPDCA